MTSRAFTSAVPIYGSTPPPWQHCRSHMAALPLGGIKNPGCDRVDGSIWSTL
jgi:hypothetical protein